MEIERLILGDFATNCYVISNSGSKDCFLIDPAGQDDILLRYLDKHSLIPQAVLLTHGHYDHILAIPALQARWPQLPVYCHPLDCPAETVEYDMGQTFPTVTAFDHVRPLCDNEQLQAAGFDVTVLHTPGHTPGSVTFCVGGALFTGDTLFYHSIGRTDFAGGDDREMARSLARLGAIAGDLPVYPGHDDATCLEDERRNNGYLAEALRRSREGTL